MQKEANRELGAWQGWVVISMAASVFGLMFAGMFVGGPFCHIHTPPEKIAVGLTLLTAAGLLFGLWSSYIIGAKDYHIGGLVIVLTGTVVVSAYVIYDYNPAQLAVGVPLMVSVNLLAFWLGGIHGQRYLPHMKGA